MARRRFFVDAVANGKAVLEAEAAEHLRKVLRAEPGQMYEISDNRNVYLAEIEGFQKNLVSLRILEEIRPDEPLVHLVLLASLIKFERFEWIVEKATELGVEKIIPVMAGRSERGLDRAAEKRTVRWRKIALESSQQSRRARLPEIGTCLAFDEALRTEGRLRFLLDEEPGAPAFLPVLENAGPGSSADVVCLLAGPEGGWTAEERTAALAEGWSAVSLGPTVLRAETALMAGVAVVNAFWQVHRKKESPPRPKPAEGPKHGA